MYYGALGLGLALSTTSTIAGGGPACTFELLWLVIAACVVIPSPRGAMAWSWWAAMPLVAVSGLMWSLVSANSPHEELRDPWVVVPYFAAIAVVWLGVTIVWGANRLARRDPIPTGRVV